MSDKQKFYIAVFMDPMLKGQVFCYRWHVTETKPDSPGQAARLPAVVTGKAVTKRHGRFLAKRAIRKYQKPTKPKKQKTAVWEVEA